MIGIVLKWTVITTFFMTLLSSVFFQPVTTLPWGIDPALTFFVTQVNQLIYALPPMEVMWHVAILYLTFRFLLLVYEMTLRVLAIILS